ncbi:MAG: Bifunctional protein GlmU [Microgenomates group bacterium GW2011_GWF2_45_18]|nr:MAG: Bifunctional protein GlmU [Microgenomates group bacterium GW2011_GWF1_44_10]KKU02354.1 MAG: Bifunctional protein GlmU [Microgenomates group bacterium GW2011_GWF2_45_18]OGJ41686.1 MAG: hypothetical protein A2378_02275 [Candidatus Pacebacteria bacterium RIFOXYB1_FULL_44_10]HAU99179.1 hypothetical protein [Candidatus Paceibacterota bacterium]HAX01709.1 hypothetical protein [Candidatus Paceibacterota bacterium]
MKHVQAIILAGGRGKRMGVHEMQNKVMIPLNGKPMLAYPVERLARMGIEHPIVVVGHAKESIFSYFGDSLIYAEQKQQLGTADAVGSALPFVDKDCVDVVVLYGDHCAFYTEEVLQTVLKLHTAQQADVTLISTTVENPFGYGRILRDENGEVSGIVEEKNATDEQKKIREINTGNAVYKKSFLLKTLPLVKMNEVSQEYYLTDVFEIGVRLGAKIQSWNGRDEALGMGVNSPDQLVVAEQEMKKRTAKI